MKIYKYSCKQKIHQHILFPQQQQNKSTNFIQCQNYLLYVLRIKLNM